jgi:hypothetical protein
MAQKISILGVKIDDRIKESGHVQELLSVYGCSIKTRLGLHEVSNDYCSTSGLIILELAGPEDDQNKLYQELLKIQGITLRKMEF